MVSVSIRANYAIKQRYSKRIIRFIPVILPIVQ